MTYDVVIAWIDMSGFELTDELDCFDGVNYKHKYKAVAKANSLLWTETDNPIEEYKKAVAYCNNEINDKLYVTVYQIESCDDCLEKARKMVFDDYAKMLRLDN